MGILNSNIGCFSSSGDLPTFPNAFSISNSKLAEGSSSFLIERFDEVAEVWVFALPRFDCFGRPPSELMNIEEFESDGAPESTPERLLFERLSAGGRDFISLALSNEMVGAVYEVITEAKNQLEIHLRYTIMVESNVGFHESLDPASELAFVLSTEYVRLLWSKCHRSRCAWCRRNDFENEFAASKTDFACWSRRWTFHGR